MDKPINVNLRLPPELHARLQRHATDDLRSLNAEIQWLLLLALNVVEEREAREGR